MYFCEVLLKRSRPGRHSFWQAAKICKEAVVLEGCTALELASAVHTDTLHLLSKASESLKHQLIRDFQGYLV